MFTHLSRELMPTRIDFEIKKAMIKSRFRVFSHPLYSHAPFVLVAANYQETRGVYQTNNILNVAVAKNIRQNKIHLDAGHIAIVG